MRITFIAGIILLLILAPVYLVPRLFSSEGSDKLFKAAADNIAAQVCELSEVQSIAVEPIKGDHHGRLRFALVHNLRVDGRLAVLGPKEAAATDDENSPASTDVQSVAVLKGRIVRNEILDGHQRVTVQTMVVHAQNGKVLWSNTWNGNSSLHGKGLEFQKTATVICLALAAGILVIFARKQGPVRETIREW